MRSLGVCLLLAWGALLPGRAFAAEYALMASGSRLHVDRHEVNGGKIRLYTGEGYAEVDAAAVKGFEAEEVVAGPIPAPVAPPVLPAVAAPVSPAAVRTPAELADQAADKYGLPRSLVRSVIAAESAFQPNVVSPKGAIGLMQLMPGTAQAWGVDPKDPGQNVDAGTRYLRDLLEKYNGGLWHALAAYNAGPGVVDKYKGVPPFAETIRYINRIDRDLKKSN